MPAINIKRDRDIIKLTRYNDDTKQKDFTGTNFQRY